MSAPARNLGFVPSDADTATLALVRDHLDAVLGFGEALVALSFTVMARVGDGSTMRAILRQNRDLGEVVARAHSVEWALLLRLTRAAELAGGLARLRPDLAGPLDVFRAGVATALDMTRSIGAPGQAVDATDAPLAWLRTRGVLSADVAGLADLATVTFDERMRIGGAVPLGVILDAAAAALDALDALDLKPAPA